MQAKYLLTVIEPAGWVILDTPRARSSGAIQRRSEAVGKPIHAYDIFLFDGVPYAWLMAQDPQKPEWGRVSEKGGVILDEEGIFEKQVEGVKAYVKVIPLQTNDESNAIVKALNRIADALENLKLK